MSAARNEQAEMPILLACGHAASAVDQAGRPACPICAGLDPGALMPAVPPDLTGRTARCCDKSGIVPSSLDLAFFEYRGERSRAATDTCLHCRYALVAHERKQRGENISRHVCDSFEPHGEWDHDTYYCGHSGWD